MKKGEKRKLELLQIAYRMFISKGYENTSVDEIIDEAGIAKGTYYYHFTSKEQMLEEVIGMMIEKEAEAARGIVESKIPVPQKIAGVIMSLRPTPEETSIEGELFRPENIFMHEKVKKKVMETAIPLLAEVVEEGKREGCFSCDDVSTRVKFILLISNAIFDEGNYEESDISVFIDTSEKLLGAKEGTMGFVRDLIR